MISIKKFFSGYVSTIVIAQIFLVTLFIMTIFVGLQVMAYWMMKESNVSLLVGVLRVIEVLFIPILLIILVRGIHRRNIYVKWIVVFMLIILAIWALYSGIDSVKNNSGYFKFSDNEKTGGFIGVLVWPGLLGLLAYKLGFGEKSKTFFNKNTPSIITKTIN